MSYQTELKIFSYKLHAEVLDLDDYKENGFTLYCCQQLSEIGEIDDFQLLFFDKKVKYEQMKVNAFGIDTQNEKLDVFVTHYTDAVDPTKVASKDIQQVTKSLGNFIKHSLKDLSNNLPKNTEEYDLARLIKSSKNKLNLIRLYILTDGLCDIDALKSTKIENINTKIEIIDLKKLFDQSSLGNIETNINLEFDGKYSNKIECIGIKNQTSDVSSYLAVIPGDILYHLYDQYRSRLMELNVRSFLQVSGKINKGIRNTLIEEPDMFFSYNNGIAVTANDIKFSQDKNGSRFIKKLEGMQIVNGGQTTASIHRAKINDDVDVSKILVPTKITIVKKEQLRNVVPKISRFSNSQNAVKQSDFHSDNPYHKKIKELSQQIFIPGESGKWYFEKLRGDYQNDKFKAENSNNLKTRFNSQTPVSRKLTKEDIAKYINAWELNPYIVCTGVQKNFIHFMDNHAVKALNDKDVDDDYFKKLISITIIYRNIEKIVKEKKYPAFRGQIIPYIVSVLSKLAGNKFSYSHIWQDQDISEDLYYLLNKISDDVRKNMLNSVPVGRNHTEWFKKIDCWNKIKDMKISLKSLDLPPELKGAKSMSEIKNNSSMSDEDLNNIKECKKISEKEWLKINSWCQENKMVDNIELGYTITLSRMAKNKWQENPTPLMASKVLPILELAYEHDII